jgi:hypothetical protein
MWQRLRFARYALRFERAFRSDEWSSVAACFHRDARYVVEGSATRWDGEVRGRDDIVAFFKRMLDALDRKFDKRVPGLRGLPRVRDGELHVPWKARYTLAERRVVLSGDSYCRFDGGAIAVLRDTMNADECRAWSALVGETR